MVRAGVERKPWKLQTTWPRGLVGLVVGDSFCTQKQKAKNKQQEAQNKTNTKTKQKT